jgi:hypothetical protein
MRTRRQQETASKSGRNSGSIPAEATTRSRRNNDVGDAKLKLAAEMRVENLHGVESGEDSEDDGDDQVEEGTQQVYVLEGVEYDDYQEFVSAKRKRNQQVLERLGFNDDSAKFMTRKKPKTATRRGINARMSADTTTALASISTSRSSRKSSRLSGDKTRLLSLDYYVNNWNADNTTVVEEGAAEENGGEGVGTDHSAGQGKQRFFKDRVNDGSDLSLQDAVELNDPKWIRDDSAERARALLDELMATNSASSSPTSKRRASGKRTQDGGTRSKPESHSPTSVIRSDGDVAEIVAKVENLSIDNEEWVAKVTPDRIYSVVTHPSESKLVCCAGDKQGYIGLWDVDGGTSDNNNGVNLFRVHSRPICCLQWLSSDSMISASYDGSIRRLDVETGSFEEVFATYDDADTTFAEDLGYGLDQGYHYWTQYVTVDPRSRGSSNPCLFVSTSVGDVFHLDLRVAHKQRITFHESVSDKKINTLR